MSRTEPAEPLAAPRSASLTTQVVTSLKWTAGLRTLGQAVTWCSTLVVMRLLRPDDYGLMALASFFVMLFALVAELGLGSALVRAEELTPRIVRQVFGIVLLINAGIILSLCGLAPLIAYLVRDQRLTPLVQALSLQFIPVALAVVPESLLKRDMQFRTVSSIEFATALIGAGTTLGLALWGAGVWTLVLGVLAMAFFKATCLNVMAPTRCLPLFSLRGLGHLVTFGGHITVAAVLSLLVTEADIFIAGRLLGTEVVGFYSISKQVASLPMQRISQILNQVMYSAFARLQGDRANMAAQLLRSIRLISFVILPAAWGMSSVAREIVLVILGPKWEPAILPLQVICLVIPFRLVSGFTNTATQSTGRADVIFYNTLIACLVMPAAFLVGCRYGLVGLSWTWVLVYPWVLAVTVQRSVGILGLRIWDILRAMATALGLSLAMYAAVAAMRVALPASVPGGARLALLVATGAAAYTGLSLAFNRQAVREVLRIVR